MEDLDESVRLAQYELVVLQPYHFLPDESTLPFYFRRADGKAVGANYYKMVNRVLREYPWNDTSPIFPAFHSTRSQVGHTVNPYLAILAAEIKFRRYLAANGPPLPPVYDSLMRKTITVAELLYFQPVGPLPGFSTPMHANLDTEGYYTPANFGVGKMGFQTGAAEPPGSSTARPQSQPAAGSHGTRCADADYWRHMLSGRGRFQFIM